MKNYYRLSFTTKKGGERHWVIDISAQNAKEARVIMEKLWKRDMHKFSIAVRRIKDSEEILYNYFSEAKEG